MIGVVYDAIAAGSNRCHKVAFGPSPKAPPLASLQMRPLRDAASGQAAE